MTLRNKHGKKAYRMAWIVEFSLFLMALSIAVFNLYTGWQQGSKTHCVVAILLAVCWVAIAFMELSTIPLAGSLSLTRWREKPLVLFAILALAVLSGWTVYEFNEAASYYMTRGARDAVIENDNDQALIRRNELIIADTVAAEDTAEKRLADVKTAYEEDVTRVKDRTLTAESDIDARIQKQLEKIDDKLSWHRETVKKNPELAAAVTELQSMIAQKQAAYDRSVQTAIEGKEEQLLEINAKRTTHERSVQSAIKNKETQLLEIREELAALVDADADVKTGPFTGGDKKRASIQQEREAIRISQNTINQDLRTLNQMLVSGPDVSEDLQAITRDLQSLRQTLIEGPDVSAELQSIKELNAQIATDYKILRDTHATAIANLMDQRGVVQSAAIKERQDITAAAAGMLAKFDSAYRAEVKSIQGLMGTKDSRIESLQENSDHLRSQVISRTQAAESAYEPVLYYRMAKWFHKGDGLPTKQSYANVQWFIFAPIGAFFSLVSIVLAYIGVSLQREGGQENAPNRAVRHVMRREKRLQALDERNHFLEEQSHKQAMDLVAIRQEAFEAVKQVPQVFKFHESVAPRPSHAMTWVPWCTCMLMSLVILGTVIYGNGQGDTTQSPMSVTYSGQSLPPNSGPSRGISDLDSLIKPVVMIQTDKGFGSGFFIRPDGLLVTNAHVIDGATQITVLTHQGPSYDGTVVVRDDRHDLALVKINASDMPVLKMTSASNVHVGSEVLAIGTPLGLEWSVSKGIVSSIRNSDDMTMLQTDAAINHGNSGGPLIHLDSRTVLGINTKKVDDSISDGIGFAISCGEVIKYLLKNNI
jgi:S1-C subfamily serine protease